MRGRTLDVGIKAQLSADNRGVVGVPVDLSARAHSSPSAVDADLHTSLGERGTASKPHSTSVTGSQTGINCMRGGGGREEYTIAARYKISG